jgi:hypothetical protein
MKSAYLLNICLDAPGHAHVHDSSDVALVKPHAKRDSRHHNPNKVLVEMHLHL